MAVSAINELNSTQQILELVPIISPPTPQELDAERIGTTDSTLSAQNAVVQTNEQERTAAETQNVIDNRQAFAPVNAQDTASSTSPNAALSQAFLDNLSIVNEEYDANGNRFLEQSATEVPAVLNSLV